MQAYNHILTIGGFDPSHGAGISQDAKTLDALGCTALSVQTCLTIQHESHIEKVYWHDTTVVLEQLELLLQKYAVDWVKISLVKDLVQLETMLDVIQELNPQARVIWDPVQTSSSGFAFNDQSSGDALERVLERMYAVLPNRHEMKQWCGDDVEAGGQQLSAFTTIYLKGGHSPEKGTDIIYYKNGEVVALKAEQVSKLEKHGSGCVFASALVAGLVNGSDLELAAIEARRIVFKYLESTPGLLGTIRSSSKTVEHG